MQGQGKPMEVSLCSKHMNEYLSNEQINSLIRKLNACYPDYFQWAQKKAQKKHIDMFGQQINDGDHYYRAKTDNNYSNDLKLTKSSMERMLYAIFANAPEWGKQAEEKISAKQNEIRDIIEKLRPL